MHHITSKGSALIIIFLLVALFQFYRAAANTLHPTLGTSSHQAIIQGWCFRNLFLWDGLH